MAWYTTGTIAVSGTTVTGTGTNFLDNTQSIGPGQALLIPGSGTVKMYEIATVTSATRLTLKTSPGTIAAGQAYAILSFYTDSVPDFARRLAAQLSYYQSQMDGWQQIMTGTGSITMTAPDGTTVTISSFSKLTTDIANALKLPTANASADLNTLIAPGIYSIPSGLANTPITANGILLVTAIASGNSVSQTFYSVSTNSAAINRVFNRVCTAASSNPAWTNWISGNLLPIEAASVDLNTYTLPGTYQGASFVNGPAVMGNASAMLIVQANGASTTASQTIHFPSANRVFVRSFVSGAWTAWVESLSSNGGTLNGALSFASRAVYGQTAVNMGMQGSSRAAVFPISTTQSVRMVCDTASPVPNQGTVTITFAVAFAAAPTSVIANNGNANVANTLFVGITSISASGFTAFVTNRDGTPVTSQVQINYTATGVVNT
ncbi:pyocin knob domain-containing protein [Pantoea rwandensis]|uniref:Phage tail protein n=1 Tax=Pantoea rwandensis TaxID=1076550 RepID=A0A1X1CNX9_9GAMM|nr:pyocin knob domain-containing protein [Pantoea rwandensis]ORM66136.1 hypothetical protein HA51_24170 [Pantoea rwandensis]